MNYGDFKKVYLKKQLQIKCYVIKHLILLKILNMTDINVDLLQWFINVLVKRLLVQTKEQKLIQI